jgi:hypothetical protein
MKSAQWTLWRLVDNSDTDSETYRGDPLADDYKVLEFTGVLSAGTGFGASTSSSSFVSPIRSICMAQSMEHRSTSRWFVLQRTSISHLRALPGDVIQTNRCSSSVFLKVSTWFENKVTEPLTRIHAGRHNPNRHNRQVGMFRARVPK